MTIAVEGSCKSFRGPQGPDKTSVALYGGSEVYFLALSIAVPGLMAELLDWANEAGRDLHLVERAAVFQHRLEMQLLPYLVGIPCR